VLRWFKTKELLQVMTHKILNLTISPDYFHKFLEAFETRFKQGIA
jgi:hypothetical protein